MPALKYYAEIEAAQKATQRDGVDLAVPFSLDVLGADSAWSRLSHAAFDWGVKTAFRFFRRFMPIVKIGRLVIVSRAEDVSEVLSRPDLYETPFGPEMTELAGGANFVLGMQDAEHDWQREIVMAIVKREDVHALGENAASIARALIENSKGRVDAMKDLFTRVSSEVCCSYFGLTATDPDAFADWSLGISALLFADPFGQATTRALALKGAEGIRAVIDRALAAPRRAGGDTLLDRLLRRRDEDPELTDAKIKAILVGLATGLIPTTTLAAGRIFQELMRRPTAFASARSAAIAGDERRLEAILFEAARLNPALSPGQWRYARKEGVIAEKRGGGTRVPVGGVLLVGTASALVDERRTPNPYTFDSARPASSYGLAFGEGVHDCLGKWVAMRLITKISRELLALPDLKPAARVFGALGWVGAFPRRLEFTFAPAAGPSGYSMPTICIPVTSPDRADAARAALREMGAPAQSKIKAALDAVGGIHFVSASLLEFGTAADPRPHLVLELNADGEARGAIARAARALEPWLGPIVSRAAPSGGSLADQLQRGVIELKTRPFGAIGLNFPGLGEFTVPDIERQSRLADFAREAVSAFTSRRLAPGGRALDALAFVRGLIRSDPALDAAIASDPTGELAGLAARGKAFAPDLLLPSRRRLALMDWTAPKNSSAILAILRDPTDLTSLKLVFAFLAILFAVCVDRFFGAVGAHGFLGWAAIVGVRGLVALALGCAAAALAFAAALGFATLWLRRLESTDVPDNREPSLETIRAAAAVEDAPGYAQNHFISVSDLKPGWFRKLTLAASLWGIKELVTRLYRPGFVVNLGTINHARWFRPPGMQKLVFFSNFDGSWHSYLEDFITKAHAGQSAAWSNGVGFPETRFLILDGALDGDRFKRWVRRQQVVSQFWYARFERLAADAKRANAMIYFGLARACDESQARDWLAQFGSLARPDAAVENEEVQSIVFRGFRGLPHAVFAPLRFPDDRSRLGAWLAGLGGAPSRAGSGDPALAATFGDNPFILDESSASVAFVAFSANGLERLGFPAGREDAKSTGFPSAFNVGMTSRARILGDFGASAPEAWRWSDDGADALLVVQGKTPEACRERLARHEAALGPNTVLGVITSQPTADGEGYEPFGFRDGLSQPVIKGTRRFARGVSARDAMEPGEFILGYKNNSGYFPLTPTVPATLDSSNRLPMLQSKPRTDFPSLDAPTALRDFGRNGTFLAVRQLAQDVEGFHREASALADNVRRRPGVEGVVGTEVTPEWVEAKLMGRWQDGSSLLERGPGKNGKPRSTHDFDNNFDFGSDDPEGFRCPLGSHIRRANPRGSLEPGDAVEQTIVNRHRILRRGRPYADSSASEQGLVFAAVCADLERQFEFVQQSWLNAPGFLNLRGEPDPIVGADLAGVDRSFTIPTPSGPICLSGLQSFVETKGGGYFFLPSLSALLFLADLVAARDAEIAAASTDGASR